MNGKEQNGLGRTRRKLMDDKDCRKLGIGMDATTESAEQSEESKGKTPAIKSTVNRTRSDIIRYVSTGILVKVKL